MAFLPGLPVRVSTHSRPKAAAGIRFFVRVENEVSTHSRPKAAAKYAQDAARELKVSTHSRPKAAATSRTNWR